MIAGKIKDEDRKTKSANHPELPSVCKQSFIEHKTGTSWPATVSLLSMKRKGLIVATLVALSIIFAACLVLRSTNAVAFLVRDRKATVEVDGRLVQGEILDGRRSAIVTRRDDGKAHSYRLFFEADTDSNRDTGWVIDCHAWVAPRFPILLEAANYPPCNILSDDVYKDRRWPLFRRGRFIEFVADDLSTIRINLRNK